MASPKQIDEYSACTTPAKTDILLGVGNSGANVFNYSIDKILSGTANLTANLAVLVVSTSNATPANSTVGGKPNGSIWTDNNYIYVALSNGHIKRAALSTF